MVLDLEKDNKFVKTLVIKIYLKNNQKIRVCNPQ